MRRIILIIVAVLTLCACSGTAEQAAQELARRVIPEYAGKIIFKEVPDTVECYSIEAQGRKVLIKGSGANAMAAGLGRYLSEVCCADVSWERVHQVILPARMPLPDSTIKSRALVPKRFFLNYCTYGYAMPWWKWEDWERFIDWMALQGINMPLALTGQESVPQGKVTILDYYTETMPVWTRTEGFYGQPYIFCYLGNFGGNTRLAVPFRTESGRITEALEKGKAGGIGCTLEGFGINRWPYEYVMSRAWEGTTDDGWLESLDRRRSSPDGFWKEMADDVLTRPAISRGPLVCVRPRMSDGSPSSLGAAAGIDNPSLVAAWKRLLDAPSGSPAWSYDAVAFGSQALAYRFATLWEEFCKAYRSQDEARAAATASRMQELLVDIDLLLSYEPSFRLDRWLDAAGKWGRTPEERQYYRHNAFLLITRWGDPSRLGDYACRLWNGLVASYYAPRWKAFTDEVLACIREGREYDKDAMNARLDVLEKGIVDAVPELAPPVLETELPDLCNSLYRKWFDHTVMSYNVGVFSKYSEDSTAQVAALLKASGASLVALNELDSCNRRHNVYQLKELAEALGGWDYHFASAFPFAGGAYGNGVVSQEPIIVRHSIALPRFDGAEPRSCAVVETENCVFASVHLDYTGASARLEQARTLNDWFTQHYSGCGKPVLLCGDMNSTPDFEAITELLKCWEPLSGTEATYPSGEPQKCIDYIFAFKAAAPVKTQSAEVYKAAVDASDHLPVIVRYL